MESVDRETLEVRGRRMISAETARGAGKLISVSGSCYCQFCENRFQLFEIALFKIF